VSRPAQCPYLALRYFEEQDSYLFYGRDEHVRELLSKLELNRFVAVLGSSGCGKSSLVRAGLLPELKSGMIPAAGHRWKVIEFKPGSSPMQELGRALELSLGIAHATETVAEGPLGIARAVDSASLEAGNNVLIIADQFEEIFSYLREEQSAGRGTEAREQAQALVRRLLDAAAESKLHIYVLLVMRSDYLGDCTQFPDLPERMNASLYLVPRLRRDQLQRAIEAPVGKDIEPAVVQRLLGEVGTDPDQLPRLQHLLSRMWFAAEGGRITLAHYDAAGGWKNALDQHLDQIYEGLTQPQQKACRLIFQRLSEIDRGRAVRRWATREQLMALCGAEADEVINRFDREGFLRLSGFNSDAVDVMHESVLRGWPRLAGWMEEENRGERRLRELATAARDSGWRPGMTAQEKSAVQGIAGLTLRNLLSWKSQFQPTGVWASRYLEAGEFEAALDFLSWCEPREARRQRAAFHRGLLFAAGLALAVFVVIGFLMLENLEDEQTVAVSKYCSNMEQVQQDFDSGDYASGYNLLRETAPLVRLRPRAAENLLAKTPLLRRALPFILRHPSLYAILNGFDRKASGGFEWNYLLARSFGDSAYAYTGHVNEVRSVAISPDGQWAVTAGADSTVRVFKVSSVLAGTGYAPDNPLDRALLVLDSNGNARPVQPNGNDPNWSVNAQLVGALNEPQMNQLPGVMSVQFSPDGAWIAIATGSWSKPQIPGTVYLWSTKIPGIVVWVRERFRLTADAVVFRKQPDAQGAFDLACAGEDNTAKFWKVAPDGSVRKEGEFSAGRQAGSGMDAAAWSPDGKTFAMVFGDGHLWIRDGAQPWNSGRPSPVIGDISGLMSIAFYEHPINLPGLGSTEQLILLGTRDGHVKSYDPNTNWPPINYLDTGQGLVTSLTISADKNLLLTTGSTGTILVWQLLRDPHDSILDQSILRTPGDSIMLRGARDVTYSAAITPDNSLIVSGGASALTGGSGQRSATDSSNSALVSSPGGSVLFWKKQRGYVDGFILPGNTVPSTWASQPASIATGGAVEALAFSPSGREFASIVGTPTQNNAPTEIDFTRLDPQSGKPAASVDANPENHHSAGTALAWSGDGKSVVTAMDDGSVLLWDPLRAAQGPKSLQTLAASGESLPMQTLSFSPGGWLAGTSHAGRTFVWNKVQYRSNSSIVLWQPAQSPTIQKVVTVPPVEPHADFLLQELTFAPSGDWLAACGVDSADNQVKIEIWNTAGLLSASPQPVRTLDGSEFPSSHGHFASLHTTCTAVAFSPNGDWLAVGTYSHEIAVWSTATWLRVEGQNEFIASGSLYGATGNHVGRYLDAPPMADSAINDVVFSPDSNRLAYAAADGNIYIWSVSAQLLVSTISVHSGGVLALAFSPDGKCLASSGNDKTVRFSCGIDPAFEQRSLRISLSPDSSSRLAGESDDWSSFPQ
jgi:WD40 repeat protein/energy-coupling factor transporter ATP-binding protein EcfA2